MHNVDTSSLPCVCTALRKASRAVTRVYDQAMEGTGLTITQFAVLRHLSRHGDLPLSRLAELLVMDRTSLYRTIEPLVSEGLVGLHDGPGKSRIAALTEAGRAAMLGATGAWETAQAAMVARIGAGGWATLAASLLAMVEAGREQLA